VVGVCVEVLEKVKKIVWLRNSGDAKRKSER